MINAREASIKALHDINKESLFSQNAIKNYDEDIIKLEDRNLFRDIVYGVLENQIFLDSIIKDLSKVRFNKIHPMILQILRVGLYQVYFLDRIPESAAVNESVKLAKKYGHKGTTGFVNGILRNAIRRKDEFLSIGDNDSNDVLAIRYSHPKYLIDMWVEQFGKEFTIDLVRANNKSPILNIRVNTLKISKESLIRLLEDKGLIISPCKLARDCLLVNNPDMITRTREFKEGLFTIQDESSILVTESINPKENSNVIDLCSAPGGKSTHIAQWMNNRGRILARDLSQNKINLVRQNMDRLGINIIDLEVHDARVLDDKAIGQYDYCLIDAPCSGFGLLRRKPEIKFNRTYKDVKSLIYLQEELLRTGSKYVKPGGYLIYTTCTINKDENIRQVEKFLFENKDFHLEPIVLSDNKVIGESQSRGYIELFPNVHNTDGFFMAKMVKKDSL